MKIIKCYENYRKLRKLLKEKNYDLMHDSIGQYNKDEYSVDITLRDYDGTWCIDYDVYKPNENEYLDGGKVCDISQMPLTEIMFWKLVKTRVKDHIKIIHNENLKEKYHD